MTLAIDLRQVLSDDLSSTEAVDGQQLVERLDGEPTIETWLATLWGIRRTSSSR